MRIITTVVVMIMVVMMIILVVAVMVLVVIVPFHFCGFWQWREWRVPWMMMMVVS